MFKKNKKHIFSKIIIPIIVFLYFFNFSTTSACTLPEIPINFNCIDNGTNIVCEEKCIDPTPEPEINIDPTTVIWPELATKVEVVNKPTVKVESGNINIESWNVNVTDGKIGVYNYNNVPLKTTLSEASPGTTFTREELYMNAYSSDIWFTAILVWLFTIANLLITGILLMRIVILWILLILSPFLLILALFSFSRGLFKTWSWVYLRWTIIWPLLAMGLGIVVYIWQLTGVPVQSIIAKSEILPAGVTNLALLAPFQTSWQTSANTEIMPIIIIALMLYAVIFLPFWLTRKSNFLTTSIGDTLKKVTKQNNSYQPTNYQEQAKTPEENKTTNNFLESNQTGNLIENFKKSYAGAKAKESLDRLFRNADKNRPEQSVGNLFAKKQNTRLAENANNQEQKNRPRNPENKSPFADLGKKQIEEERPLTNATEKNPILWKQGKQEQISQTKNALEHAQIAWLKSGEVTPIQKENFEKERKNDNLIEEPISQNTETPSAQLNSGVNLNTSEQNENNHNKKNRTEEQFNESKKETIVNQVWTQEETNISTQKNSTRSKSITENHINHSEEKEQNNKNLTSNTENHIQKNDTRSKSITENQINHSENKKQNNKSFVSSTENNIEKNTETNKINQNKITPETKASNVQITFEDKNQDKD